MIQEAADAAIANSVVSSVAAEAWRHRTLGTDSDVTEYLAIAAGGGLAAHAAREIESVCELCRGAVRCIGLPPATDQWAPDGPPDVFAGGAGVAKLRFALPTPASHAGWAAHRDSFARLKCTQYVLAFVDASSSLPFDARDGLAHIADMVRQSAGWDGALRAWRGHKERGGGERVRFRASCVRDGQHAFSSVDAASALGDAAGDRFDWAVDLGGFELELVALALQHELVLGVSLSANPRGFARSSLPAEPRPLLPHSQISARLRCSTAALMLQLAALQPGDVLLDPMCGVGTLPLEATA